MFSFRENHPDPKGLPPSSPEVLPGPSPLVVEARNAAQAIQTSVEGLAGLEGRDQVEAAVKTMRAAAVLEARAEATPYSSKDRKEMMKIADQHGEWKLADRIAPFIVRSGSDLEFVEFLSDIGPFELRDRSLCQLTETVAYKLISKGTKDHSDSRSFSRGLACAEFLYVSGGATRPEGSPEILDSSKSRFSGKELRTPGEMIKEYYDVLWRSAFDDACLPALAPVVEPALKRAVIEHSEYLKNICGNKFLVCDDAEDIAVHRAYFIAKYSGDENLYLNIMRQTPAFGLLLAGSGAGTENKDFYEATAEALCKVGDWLWNYWRAEHEPDTERFGRDLASAADCWPEFTEEFRRTARQIQRVLTGHRKCVGDAPDLYTAKATAPHHEAIRDRLG